MIRKKSRKSIIKNCILLFYAILYICSTKILITHFFSRTANHSDGLTELAIIHSENSKADNQLKLTNLHVHKRV